MWGRKDGFPGADGSTIQQTGIPNAGTSAIYGADGSVLTEGSTGVQFVDVEDVVNGNTSLVYVIKKPLTYIYTATALNDWYTTNSTYQNNTLWQGDIKGTYDPCPNGWQVPQDGTWNDFTTDNTSFYIQGTQMLSGAYYATNGGLYNRLAWFPAAGYRTNTLGVLYRVGEHGLYWFSTVNGTYGKYGYIHQGTDISFNSNSGRVGCISVRCVQE